MILKTKLAKGPAASLLLRQGGGMHNAVPKTALNKQRYQPGVVVHTIRPSNGKAEASRPL